MLRNTFEDNGTIEITAHMDKCNIGLMESDDWMLKDFDSVAQKNDWMCPDMDMEISMIADGEEIATVYGKAYDEYLFDKSDEMLEHAMTFDKETGKAFEALINKSGRFLEEYNDKYEYDIQRGTVAVNLMLLYVAPKYRNKDIMTYILNNLNNVIEYYTGYSVRYATIKPETFQKDGDKYFITEDKNLMDITLQLLDTCGYEKIADTDIYFRKYCGKKRSHVKFI